MTFNSVRVSLFAMLLGAAMGCAEENDSAASDQSEAEAPENRAQVSPVDPGYEVLPRAWVDQNLDGRTDYCRFVGDWGNVFISCKLDGNANEYAYNSRAPLDLGHKDRPREFVDYNRDGRIDFCRWVGDSPNIRRRCVRGGVTGFEADQYYDPATDRPESAPVRMPTPQTPASPYAWYTVSCMCSSGVYILNKQICLHNSNTPSWSAQGACGFWCTNNSLGTPIDWSGAGPQGTCIQTSGNAFL